MSFSSIRFIHATLLFFDCDAAQKAHGDAVIGLHLLHEGEFFFCRRTVASDEVALGFGEQGLHFLCGHCHGEDAGEDEDGFHGVMLRNYRGMPTEFLVRKKECRCASEFLQSCVCLISGTV